MTNARAALSQTAFLVLGATGLTWFFACGSSQFGDGANNAGGDASDESNSINGGRADAARPPTHAPASLTFRDEDPVKGSASGSLKIGKAPDESDVTSYKLYWGGAGGARLASIATLPKSGMDLAYALAAPIPAGATDLLVFSANEAGEMGTGPSAAIGDNFPAFADVSAGQDAGAGYYISAAVDVAGGKVIVATDNAANAEKPAAFRCNLDGTGCTYVDISAGQGANSGSLPSAAIDKANGKLLVATTDGSNIYRPGLFVCNVDGTACVHRDISLAQGSHSGLFPSLVVDALDGKVLVVTDNNANLDKPGLFRCNLDGTSCAYFDISAGQGQYSGTSPSAVLDAVNSRFLVVTNNAANGQKPGLFRCPDLDFVASCTYVDISAGRGANSGGHPSAVIDAVAGKLLVVTDDDSDSASGVGHHLGLFRCNLDGSSCTYANISAGQGAGSGTTPSAVIDAVNGKLLVATNNGANGNKPSLFRCNLDGTACTHVDMSDGQNASSGFFPSAVIDAAHGRVLIATTNIAALYKPSLFSLGLW